MSSAGATTARSQAAPLARNTAWNLAGMILPVAAAAVAMPELVRRFGADRFGILSLVWMVQGFASELGFGRATTRFVALLRGRGERARLPHVVWTTVALQLAIGLLGALALLTAAGPIVRALHVQPALLGDARAAVRAMAVLLPVTLVSSAFRGLLEAEQRFDYVNVVRLPSTAAMFLLPLAAVLLGAGLSTTIWLIVVARAAGLAAYAGLAVRQAPAIARPQLRGEDAAAIVAFGGWVTVSTLVSPALAQIERWLLGALVGMAALGYYTPAVEVGTRLAVVPAAFIATLFPALTGLVGEGDPAALAPLASRAGRIVLALFGPVVLAAALGAGDLLRLWLGSDFAARSTLALQLLLVGVLINALAQVPFAVLQSLGRADVTAKVHLAELPLQVPLAYLLVSRWGIPGAAAAWSARATIDALLLFLLAGRLSPLSWRALRAERVPQLMLVLLGLGAAGAAFVGTQSGLTVRLGVVTLSLAGALVLLWHFALAPAERGRVVAYATLLRRGAAQRT